MSYTLFYEINNKIYNADVLRHTVGELLYKLDEGYEPQQRIELCKEHIPTLKKLKENDWSKNSGEDFAQIIADIEKFGSVGVWLE